ncbi:protein Skeletor, isoforms B/C-like isoform X1 [Watersipora subatra]|uniref:protein Skeletor, isoforms B/C-like isoform X1 n=1 Tax=Watersipora subatra TaxID=2589382 RepID=UPI00355B1E17
MKILKFLLLVTLGCSFVLADYPYYGKLLQSGWSNPRLREQLDGDIYIADSSRVQVVDFTFDSSLGDAAFILGTSQSYGEVMAAGGFDPTAVVLANPTAETSGLRSYEREKLVLQLPNGSSITQFTYIGVGILSSMELLGGADIPTSFSVPAPVEIGTFTTRAHLVSSGTVTVLTDRLIQIKAFTYDGNGPDAFFYVGTTDRVSIQRAPYGIIPDENGVTATKAGRYNSKDITLTLPSTISATDLKWLSMFCISYSHNFGEVVFPSNLNVPAHIDTVVPAANEEVNCEALSDDLQISWSISGGNIIMELAGRIDRSTDYMAFGLSGSTERPMMIGSDVVVVDYREGMEPRAIDYYIEGYSQCSTFGGVCPDSSPFLSSNDDASVINGEVNQGITRVSYRRSLTTADIATGKDQEYLTDGTFQQIVWSVGPINSLDQAAKHYTVGGRITASKTINFGRSKINNCPVFGVQERQELPLFKPHHLYGKEGVVFTVEIGPSWSEQGYKAITGLPSWGIAWYINGLLVPELHLKRGVSYTFKVAGGTDSREASRYHPFYFTDSPEGGYGQSGEGNIYEGMVAEELQNFAVGDYCEWKFNIEAEDKIYQCFEELQKDLYLECVNDSIGYTEFVFTPGSQHPDTIYYQCYTHKNLGWKVRIYDELPTEEIPAQDCTASAVVGSCISPDPLISQKCRGSGTIQCSEVTRRQCRSCETIQSTCCNACWVCKDLREERSTCRAMRRNCSNREESLECREQCSGANKEKCCKTCCRLYPDTC